MSNILMTTFAAMPEKFTSNEFIENAKVLGLTDDEVKNGVVPAFLHPHCIPITKRTWRKRITTGNTLFDTPCELTEEKCIAFLKERGYKIMKMMEV